jgi:riboflavin kinase / FMN adenylyltransferase
MMLVSTDQAFPDQLRESIVAIGNFDGMHRGHQTLLGIAREEARRRRKKWGIVTFEPHPRSFFRPREPIFRLTPLPLKARLAAALGVDFVVALAFDASFAAMTPEEFVQKILVAKLGAAQVVMGYDFHFGRGRKGSPETMMRLGQQLGFGTTIVDQVTDDDGIAPFSSSSIRDALRHGHVRQAALELGYWWTIEGEVLHGAERGRAMGMPTVNIALEEGAEPAQGIYATRVRDVTVENGQSWRAAGYFGKRPTFNGEQIFAEAFLFDFSGDLYGRRLAISFVDFIRGDRHFESTEDLVTQMNADCIEIGRRLEEIARDDPVSAFPLGKLQAEGRL